MLSCLVLENVVSLLAFCLVSNASPLPAAGASGEPPGVMRLPMSRHNSARVVRRQTVDTQILSDHIISGTLGYYYVTVEIGTPAQSIDLLVDTGSSDLWVYGPQYCGTGYECFVPDDSSTAASTDLPELVITYGGNGLNSGVNGTFISDTFAIGGTALQSVDIAVVFQGQGPPGGGILGLSFDVSEATDLEFNVVYPDVLDDLYNAGIISSYAFSLYLDDLTAPSGALLFGGYDTAKYTGDLVSLPMVFAQTASGQTFAQLGVPWSSISITDPSGYTTDSLVNSEPLAALLDSGTPLAALPTDIFLAVVQHIGELGYAVTNLTDVAPVVDCALGQVSGSVNLGFADQSTGASVTIAVPFSELAVPNPPEEGGCTFGIYEEYEGNLIFGDTFMRSMYIVYDLQNKIIALAQSSFNREASNIVPIG